jgi:hypothetical protein
MLMAQASLKGALFSAHPQAHLANYVIRRSLLLAAVAGRGRKIYASLVSFIFFIISPTFGSRWIQFCPLNLRNSFMAALEIWQTFLRAPRLKLNEIWWRLPLG